MGRFDGMLLVSDYDNTLRYTEEALREGGETPPIAPRNIEAIRYWIAQGGKFGMATGRSLAAFRRHAGEIPMNAPTIVDNGGAIYDFASEQYVLKRFLPDGALAHLVLAAEAFPGVSMELYPEDAPIHVVNPTDWNEKHAALTGLGYQVVERLTASSVPLPLAKALFVAEKPELEALKAFMTAAGWGVFYEMIFSSDHLLELTAKGANKGDMALHLKEMCGCDKLYCIGDHANDLPMLRAAHRAFAPANAIGEVLTSGAEIVCHCRDGALAEVVERLANTGLS